MSEPIGFCPYCKQNVLVHRGEFNFCLAIILLIFTGIGFIIYVIWYYRKPENICVHCGTEIDLLAIKSDEQLSYIASEQNFQEIEADIAKFCPFCGVQLASKRVKFCHECGGQID